MKKCLLLVAALLLVAGMSGQAMAATAKAPNPASRIEQMTGEVWMQSSADVKLATIFGVETAIEIELGVSDEIPGAAKASPFAAGWVRAFRDVPTSEIVTRVDAWYAANPRKTDRSVLEMIWSEFIKGAK